MEIVKSASSKTSEGISLVWAEMTLAAMATSTISTRRTCLTWQQTWAASPRRTKASLSEERTAPKASKKLRKIAQSTPQKVKSARMGSRSRTTSSRSIQTWMATSCARNLKCVAIALAAAIVTITSRPIVAALNVNAAFTRTSRVRTVLIKRSNRNHRTKKTSS